MDSLMATSSPSEYFQIKRYGDIAVIVPSPEIENLPENMMQTAAQLVLAPLKANPPTSLIVDLSAVAYFGSAFISFLLQCHLIVKKQDSELVLAGASDRIRELLRNTALDTLWAVYDSRDQALEALGGSF